MKNVVKKLAILSMVGMMQIGLGASVIEASPLHNEPAPMQQKFDRDRGQHGDQRNEHGRQQRERAEKERHEKEMKRRPNETKKHWHERQKHENERHERDLRTIRNHR